MGEKEEEREWEEVDREEAKSFRGVVARINFMGQYCPDVQFPIKACSRDLAKPTRGAWKKLKKLARYLLMREAIVWEYNWQGPGCQSYVVSDSDWGGSAKDRKST